MGLGAELARLIEATDAALRAHPAAVAIYPPTASSGDATAARAVCDSIIGPMAALLAADDPLPTAAQEALDGQAVGNLVYADPEGRFHVLAVVFPEGTSSGVHHHGCWGVIGYLRGGDEETRYRPAGAIDGAGGLALEEMSRHVWHQGDITMLLPPLDGWHRVRNPGPGPGVSVHVLCRRPADHPHHFWDRATGAVHPFPFEQSAPDRWRAVVRPG